MKKSLVLASLVVASTSMMAMDLQYFLGAGIERVDVDYKDTAEYSISGNSGVISLTDSVKDTGLLLKAGVILNKTHRISISRNGTHIKVYVDDKKFLDLPNGLPVKTAYTLILATNMWGDGLYFTNFKVAFFDKNKALIIGT